MPPAAARRLGQVKRMRRVVEIEHHIKAGVFFSRFPDAVSPVVQNAQLAAEILILRQPWMDAVNRQIRHPRRQVIAALGLGRLPEHRMRPAECDQLFRKLPKGRILFCGRRPRKP